MRAIKTQKTVRISSEPDLRHRFGYDYFISYAHDDGKEYAGALYHQLIQSPYNLICFLDQEELSAGALLTEEIRKALESSQHLIVVASSGALQSDWVSQEIEFFQKLGRPICVVDVDRSISNRELTKSGPWPKLSGAGSAESLNSSDNTVFDSIVRETEGKEDFKRGQPSDLVLRRLDTTITIARRKDVAERWIKSMRRAAAILGIVALSFLVTASFLGWRSSQLGTRIKQQNKAIIDKDVSIADKDNKIVDRDQQILDQGHRIDLQGHEIKDKANEIQEQSAKIAGQKQSIAARDTVIQGQKRAIEQNEADLKRQVANIESLRLAGAALERMDSRLDNAVDLSMKAFHKADMPQARHALLTALTSSPHLVRALGRFDRVRALAISPTGSMVAASTEKEVLLWRWKEHREPIRLAKEGLRGGESMRFSPDERVLVVGGADGRISLISTATGRLLSPPLKFGNYISSITVASDGSMAAGGMDGDLSIWSKEGGRFKRVDLRLEEKHFKVIPSSPFKEGLPEGDGRLNLPLIADLTFDGSSSHLFARIGNDTIGFWTKTRAWGDTVPVYEKAAAGASFRTIAVCPDGLTLGAGIDGGAFKFWSIRNCRLVPLTTGPLGSKPPLRSNTEYIEAMAFAEDGRSVCFVADGKTIDVYPMNERKLNAKNAGTLSGLGSELEHIALSKDGGLLATASSEGDICVWKADADPTIRSRVDDPPMMIVHGLRLAPDGTVLIADYLGGTLFWNLKSHKALNAFNKISDEYNLCTASHPDGRGAASITDSGWLQEWRLDSKAVSMVTSYRLPGKELSLPTKAAIHSSLSLAAATDLFDNLYIWNLRNKTAISLPPPKTRRLFGIEGFIAFAPRAPLLFIDSTNGLEVWDLKRPAKPRLVFQSPMSHLTAIAFDESGNRLAFGDSHGTVTLATLRRSQGGQLSLENTTSLSMPDNRGEVTCLALGPLQAGNKYRYLAAGLPFGEVLLWDIAHGYPLGPFWTGNSADITGVQFSSDGRTLYAGSGEGLAAWDLDVKRWVGDATELLWNHPVSYTREPAVAKNHTHAAHILQGRSTPSK